MSAERRYDQRRFRLEESTTLNGGARTVFVEHMPPGTAVPPHWHDHFSETFDLVAGSMRVYSAPEGSSVEAIEAAGQPLQVGVKVTVPPRRFHRYVVGAEPTTLRATITPGYLDFERLLMVLNGMAEDADAGGEGEGGGAAAQEMGDSLVLMVVVMDLANANLIGESGEQLEAVRREKGAEIAALKQSLLAKYDTPEQLRKLMQM